MTKILDGKLVAKSIKEQIKEEVTLLIQAGEKVKLAIVSVGDDPASKIYIRNKVKAAEKVGIEAIVFELPSTYQEESLILDICDLNKRDDIDGIIVQLPLPKHINSEKVQEAISMTKDVDVFCKENVGLLVQNRAKLLPCTPAGIVELMNFYNIDVWGKNVCIIGYSNIVGKPLSIILSNKGATVTTCNSKTKNLALHTKCSDIVIVATGVGHLIDSSHLKDGAIVIDVGITRLDHGKIIGDVNFDDVYDKVSYISPVPGGVGPMTVAMLLKNTLLAHNERKKRLKK